MKSVVIAAGVAAYLAFGGAQALAGEGAGAVGSSERSSPFDWNGFYVGSLGGLGASYWNAGFQMGGNMVTGRFLGSLEVRLAFGGTSGLPLRGGTFSGRAGVVVGSEDRLLLYGTAGLGLGGQFWAAGGGVGVGVGERWSLFVEGNFFNVFALGCCGRSIQFGLNRHP